MAASVNGCRSGRKGTTRTEKRYNALRPIATANFQSQCLACFGPEITTDKDNIKQPKSVLQVCDASTNHRVLDNMHSHFNIVVYIMQRKVCYHALSTHIFAKHKSANMSSVMDAYVGYCTHWNRSMMSV